MDTSASLLERLRDTSDNEAWQRFADVYGPLLYRWLKGSRLQHDAAADVAQEVLVVVLRKLPGFQYDRQCGMFRAWLRTIVRKQLLVYIRRRKSFPPGVGDSGWNRYLAELEDPHSALSARWDREYAEVVTRRALEQIRGHFKATTWQAFWQVVMEGRPADEVAEELGLTCNAVYIAKARVQQRLKREMRGLLD